MKIGITGIERKLGKAIALSFQDCVGIDEDLSNISNLDVFVNNLAKANLQIKAFDYLSKLWVNENKTIVNIISSVVFQENNSLGSYGDLKIKLNQIVDTFIQNNPNKKLRIINLYPSTLSSNKMFDEFNKIDIRNVAETVAWAVNLPQEIELRNISIYSTSRDSHFKISSTI